MLVKPKMLDSGRRLPYTFCDMDDIDETGTITYVLVFCEVFFPLRMSFYVACWRNVVSTLDA